MKLTNYIKGIKLIKRAMEITNKNGGTPTGFVAKQPIVGHFKAVLRDKDGNIKAEIEKHNLVTVEYDRLAADRVSGGSDTLATYMGVGTGTGQTSTDTDLATSVVRVILDSTTQGAGGDDNDVIYVTTFPAGTGTGALTEAGLFDASTAGNMFLYDDFAVINKGALDSLVITWTVTFGNS